MTKKQLTSLGSRDKRHSESCSTQASTASAPLRFFDIFSGIGGFKLGLERAGFKSIGYCDNNTHAVKLYNAYYNTEKELYFNDITTIDTKDLPDFDILCAGFPCQPFSISGKRQGFSDTRGTMFFEIERILKDKKPKYFILENVRGLLNHEGGRTFEVIINSLNNIGYSVQWQLLNSKFFGVPQNRERVYIVGCLGKECPPKIFPINGIASEKVKSINSYKFIKRGSQSNVAYSPDGIIGCLTTGCQGFIGDTPACEVKEPKDVTFRRPTPLECFRIQGFPDDMVAKAKEIDISDTQLYHMAGNAVTVNVIEVVAKKLAEAIKNDET